MKKRISALILAFCMVLALMPATALAEGTGNVAKIGDTEYDTLQAAVERAQNGDTITLIADVVLEPKDGEKNTLSPLITIDKDLTLDLAGHSIEWDTDKITDDTNYEAAIAFFAIQSTVTITGNGTIDAEAKYNSSYGINVNGGNLTIESGTFYGAMTAVQVQTGNLFIKGGTFDLAETIKAADSNSEYAKYIINAIDKNYKNGAAAISITGGTFVGFDPSDNPEGEGTSYLPADSTLKYDEETKSVVEDTAANAVASVNNVKFTSVQAAINAANAGDTVTLLNDATISKSISLDKSITLDLGGKTVTGDGGNSMFSHSGEDTISVTVKNGSVTGEVSGFKWNGGSGSTLTLDNVKLTTEAAAINVLAGTVTVSKDTIVTGNAEDQAVHVGKKGTLNVYGTVACTGDEYAIYSGSPEATINVYPGATVKSEGEAAIYLDNESTLNITGGTIIGSEECGAIGLGEADEDDEESTPVTGENISVSGGSFSSSVAKYVVESLNAELVKSSGDAPYNYYTSVEEALKDAQPGDTITNLNENGEASEPVAVVTVTYQNGSKTTTEKVLKGDTVTLPTLNNDGYNYFQGWSDGTTTYKGGATVTINANVTFTAQWTYIPPVIPSGPTTPTKPVDPTPDPVWTNPFVDVKETDWFYDAVAYVCEKGLMNGVTAESFQPNAVLSRAMVCQILYNMNGKPVVLSASGFSDVAPTAWYSDAIAWAAAKGYVTGYTAETFGPNDPVTREQLAAVLYRYSGSPAVSGSLNGYVDQAQVSAYAVNAMTWAVQKGLITGETAVTLAPAGQATRAQCATIFARYDLK